MLMINFITGISLVKISITLFLLRFVEGKMYKWFLICIMVFISVITIACEGPMIFQCLPVSAIFKVEKPPTAKCISQDAFNNIGILNGSANVFTDFVLVVLPIHIVLKLHMNKRRKIALVCIFSLGICACIIATVRVSIGARFFTAENRDYTWNCASFILNAAELHIGILAASLPSLRPLFFKILDSARKYGTGDLPTSRYGTHTDSTRTVRSGYCKQEDIPMNNMKLRPPEGRYSDQIVSSVGRGNGDASSEEGILTQGTIRMTTEITISEEPNRDRPGVDQGV
ncbi:uncharacterized protein BCR38DRAFT_130457 [Pseudomassariella vexata]|uniref:Rhodopsin domain-containing protein n=1 Tax=Pseudomassariella vexata TaxID=1141098 RepID=A0A1Y2E9T9_9PEZI|nr:uncharacterized protein BCR38DRAFT_130457 [Pseudomassariella vexata]ORY68343.1 hypothetical protein BCR38DRAFT_130457 [Pseudomassariella vexata]